MVKTTINRILQEDSINGLLADLESEAGELASVMIISRSFNGEYHLTFYGSEPEVLGLCELGKLSIITMIQEREDSEL